MKSYADTNQEKSKRGAERFSKPHRSDRAALQFVDNRSAAVAQRQLAEAIHGSPKQVAQGQQLNRLFGKAAQLQSMDEDELQMKTDSAVVQRMGEELLQGKFETVQKQENKTGLPDNLKSGMENLSGQSLDHVKVHYNSPKPAAVQAHAYAQGSDIHLASGQEKHLPHELGHVVQQAQGRVKPTTSVGGMQVNDNPGLENEATMMGQKAMQLRR